MKDKYVLNKIPKYVQYCTNVGKNAKYVYYCLKCAIKICRISISENTFIRHKCRF